VELSFSGTFAPVEQKVQELLLHGTFTPVELSLFRSECPKNFRSRELLFPGTVSPSLPYLKTGGKHYSDLSIGNLSEDAIHS